MGLLMTWIYPLLALTWACRSVAFAADHVTHVANGGALAANVCAKPSVVGETGPRNEVSRNLNVASSGSDIESIPTDRPLRVMFLSSDTGGGHRASAEALGKQFLLQYPGSSYELVDVWTDHGVLPYKTLVNTYKHLSSHPRQWRLFYHLSNNMLNEVCADFHSKLTCFGKIRRRIEEVNPDVVVSVHPTMNYTPLLATQEISKSLGKHIPFFTVVTDLGSGHTMWFQKNVDKLYVASERLRKLARRRGPTPEETIVMTGLPIRHDFAVQAENMGDRTSEVGKAYQQDMRVQLGINKEKPMVLVMGGGEGVGSLSSIVDELYTRLTNEGVNATICVVCGRNEKLKGELEDRDWEKVMADLSEQRSRRRKVPRRMRKLRSKRIEEAMANSEKKASGAKSRGSVEVVGLGFVTNMAEYMAAANILVTKAGPGTIAEAAAVGLPVMLTSFLPGQEAGNVDVVLESGFGDYNEDPQSIAKEVGYWLQDDDLLQYMSKSAQSAGNPYAADEIVRDIGSQTQMWMHLNGEPQS